MNIVKNKIFLMVTISIIVVATIVVALVIKKSPPAQSSTDEVLTSATTKPAPALEYGTLPPDIKWITNNEDPIFADSNAKRGGVIKLHIPSFPVTLRTYGPDSNGNFRMYLLDNLMVKSLVKNHPETKNLIPELATHWYFAPDHKTMYFKLNPKATWTDGVKITAKDYAFTLEFMRSEWIYDPWSNDYYTNTISKVLIIDDYTIAVVGVEERSDFENGYYMALSPTPEHYYRPIFNKDLTKEYNWELPPSSDAYVLKRINKGKSIVLKRIDKWWAEEERYYKNTNNFDEIRIEVIRDENMAFDYLQKWRIDFFNVSLPSFWDKATGVNFDNGYINKIQFYNDMSRPSFGFWLNTTKWPFDDLNVRLAFAHALNFDKVIKDVLRGEPIRLERFDHGSGKYDDTNIRAYPFDIQKTSQYMLAAGWIKNSEDGIWYDKNKQAFSIEVIYGQEAFTSSLTVLREEALKAGIDLKLRMLDFSTTFKTALEKQHQVAYFGMGGGSLIPHLWEFWHSDNALPQTNNFTMIKDAKLDELIDDWKVEFDDTKKHKIAKDVQKRVHDLGIYIPGYINPFFKFAYTPWIKLPKKIPPATYRLDEAYNYCWFDEDVYKAVTNAKGEKQPFQKPVFIVDETYRAK